MPALAGLPPDACAAQVATLADTRPGLALVSVLFLPGVGGQLLFRRTFFDRVAHALCFSR